MNDQLHRILVQQYGRARNWQTKQGIQFDLSLEEFIGLWSTYRLRTLQTKLDRSDRFLQAYLDHPTMKPVCSWINKDARAEGIMHKGNARIMRAEESKRMFGFKKGDKHTEETIEAMRVPKSDKQKANMSTSAKARWAKVRAEKAAQLGGQA